VRCTSLVCAKPIISSDHRNAYPYGIQYAAKPCYVGGTTSVSLGSNQLAFRLF
jgi:hypothetical protein